MVDIIGPKEVVRELAGIVNEYGPDTKRQCEYLEYDEEGAPVAPHCIAGVFLYRHGMTLNRLKGFEGSLIGGITDNEMREFGFELAPRSRYILELAQEYQDSGNTWGDAVAHATNQYQEAYVYGD